MNARTLPARKPIAALRRIALRLPETLEGMTCGKQAFKARNKAFLFVGSEETTYNIMVKLRDALPEAASLQAKSPEKYAVGGHGWVKATFSHSAPLPVGRFERWIEESYRLLVPRQLVAFLSSQGALRVGARKSPRKRAPQRDS